MVFCFFVFFVSKAVNTSVSFYICWVLLLSCLVVAQFPLRTIILSRGPREGKVFGHNKLLEDYIITRAVFYWRLLEVSISQFFLHVNWKDTWKHFEDKPVMSKFFHFFLLPWFYANMYKVIRSHDKMNFGIGLVCSEIGGKDWKVKPSLHGILSSEWQCLLSLLFFILSGFTVNVVYNKIF